MHGSGSTTIHDRHDELLIVRLYGNDVTEAERETGLTLLATCEECAALFADLGFIAAETAALPAPARPRDFTLSPAAAQRLRRGRRPEGLLGTLRRWSRPLGSVMAAAGLAGVLLAGTGWSLPFGSSQLDRSTYQAPVAAPQKALTGAAAASGGGQGGASENQAGAAASPASLPSAFGVHSPQASGSSGQAPAMIDGKSGAPSAPAAGSASPATDTGTAGPVPAPGSAAAASGEGPGLGARAAAGGSAGPATPSGASGQGSEADGRALAFAASGIVLVAGLALLAASVVARRRRI